ncbi:28S ribosomal protein S11, mitochondrial [Nowakowskiella sp. JEL0407]|nr:28S ribosomal protein S11, mitochondrial [Nowakowskiella sp. JEL0407]
MSPLLKSDRKCYSDDFSGQLKRLLDNITPQPETPAQNLADIANDDDGSTPKSNRYFPDAKDFVKAAFSPAKNDKEIIIDLKDNSNSNYRASSFHVVHIRALKNNTFAILTECHGAVLVSISAGLVGLKKANRGTSDAGYLVVQEMAARATLKGISVDNIQVVINGFGPGREQATRSLQALGWKIIRVTDRTPVRHGGCRPRKKRML